MTHQIINPRLLKLEAVRGEMDIDEELHEIEETLEVRLTQIGRKSHIAWQKFPARLIVHGKRLIEQGERMAKLSPMPTESQPLRKFNSPQEWQQSLFEDSSVKNTSMTHQQRIDNYRKQTGFPRSLFVSEDGRIVGTWIMGNDYRVQSGYYGGYPAGYLRRIRALFPDKRNVLHLFSGKVDLKALPGKTVDINPDNGPDYVDDAQALTSVPLEQFDLILADPPYSVEDADHYQTTMVKRNVVLRALGLRLCSGSHVVWLDQVLPMYRKDQFDIVGVIGIVKSTNHRFRVCSIFQCRER